MGNSKKQNNYEKCRQEMARKYNERIKALEEENKKLIIDNIELKKKLRTTEDELEQLKTDLKLLGLGDKKIVDSVPVTTIHASPEIGDILNKYSGLLGKLTF